MIPDIINIGCKIEIRILQQARREGDRVVDNSRFFTSKVADIDQEKNVIYIYAPLENSIPRFLEPNIRYDFIFITSYGLYRAEAKSVGRKKDGELLYNAVVLTSKTAKFQRREFYREACSIPVDFLEISEEVATLGDITAVQEATKEDIDRSLDYGTILDISGGGIRYSTDGPVKTGIYALYEFELGQDDKTQKMVVVGYIIASEKVEGKQNLYHNRVKFIFKNKREQEKIVRFVFEEQRRKRQNSNS